jgi:ElaB/YqjD/DUF883 family membrane-anchored ribosome-binding protein
VSPKGGHHVEEPQHAQNVAFERAERGIVQFFPYRRRFVMNYGALNSSFTDLRNDLQAVARDAEALLKATANVTGEGVGEIRTRTQETVRRAYDHLYSPNKERVRQLARDTDSYVHENSWTVIGAAVGVGLLAGLLLASRRDYREY